MARARLVCVILTVYLSLASSKFPSQELSPHFPSLQDFAESIQKEFKKLSEMLAPRPFMTPAEFMDRLSQYGMRSGRCYLDLVNMRINQGLKADWAMMMGDATAHPGSGLMEQEFDFLGVDDECLETEIPLRMGFSTRYCVITLLPVTTHLPSAMKPSKISGLSAGVCIPDSCDERHMTIIFNQVLKDKNLSNFVGLGDIYIRGTNDIELGGSTGGVIAFISLWLVLLLIGTLCDVLHVRSSESRRQTLPRAPPALKRREQPGTSTSQTLHQPERDEVRSQQSDKESTASTEGQSSEQKTTSKQITAETKHIKGILQGRPGKALAQIERHANERQVSGLVKVARCFSLYTNLPKLLDTSCSGTEISCLQGIRVISCGWVILIHTMYFKALYIRNGIHFLKKVMGYTGLYSILANGLLGLDSLFTLSGLLVGYSGAMRISTRQGKNRWLCFVLYRYLRTAPTLVLVGIMYLIFFPHMTGGPLWDQHAPSYDECVRWGWMNVFLIHNFAPAICLSWTWFFAVDFQLFILAPLLLVMRFRSARLAYIVMAVLVLTCWVVGGVVTQLYHLPVSQYVLPDLNNVITNHANSTGTKDFGRLYLYLPYTHAGSFFPALLLGFSLYTTSQRASFNRKTVIVGWLAALAGMAVAVFSARDQMVDDGKTSVAAAAVYNSVHRTLWSVCVCWVILACSTGYGGPVNSLLSWQRWKPLSRLVFVAYVVHPMIIMAHNACQQQMVYMTPLYGLYLLLAVFVLSFLVSLLLTVTLEMPITALIHLVGSCCCDPAC